MSDLKVRELVVVTPLIALLLFLGVYPKPLTDIITRRSTTRFPTCTRPIPSPRWRRKK